MNESLPSTLFTGNWPQMSVWIIYKILMLRLSSFLIFFTYFSFMHSLHCSKYENSNGGRISFLTSLCILPLEIWPKRQCHNFDNASWALLCHLFQINTLWPAALSAKWHMSLKSQWTDSLYVFEEPVSLLFILSRYSVTVSHYGIEPTIAGSIIFFI